MTKVGNTFININIDGAKKAIEEGIRDGLQSYANFIMPVIKVRTPVDTGALRESEKEETIDNGLGKRFSANKDYALIQHENVFFNHPKGGGAKYLTGPINETIDQAEKMISNSIKDKLH